MATLRRCTWSDDVEGIFESNPTKFQYDTLILKVDNFSTTRNIQPSSSLYPFVPSRAIYTHLNRHNIQTDVGIKLKLGSITIVGPLYTTRPCARSQYCYQGCQNNFPDTSLLNLVYTIPLLKIIQFWNFSYNGSQLKGTKILVRLLKKEKERNM